MDRISAYRVIYLSFEYGMSERRNLQSAAAAASARIHISVDSTQRIVNYSMAINKT